MSLPFPAVLRTLRVFRPKHQPSQIAKAKVTDSHCAPLAKYSQILTLLIAWPFQGTIALALDRVSVTNDGFVLASSGKPFVPWGVNYGNRGRLMEDFWNSEWSTIEGDFREIRALGANLVRIHLQFGKFMEAADRPNAAAFQKLRELIALAERSELYLNVTGLGCYRPADVPPWYDTLPEAQRWNAQAMFWSEVARTCTGQRAVFCYDLMNEPISPADKKEKWYSGHLLGGYDFIQHIALDPAGRTRQQIASAWIGQLRTAIREHDRSTPITVGMLPWVTNWKHLSGFVPAEMVNEFDFLSVHIYPKTKDPAEARTALKECALGKPVIIEETFPLECSIAELEAFLQESRSVARGWVWHYDGITPAEYATLKKSGTYTAAQSIWHTALESFQRLGPEFRGKP
jgi:hypothetical protein